MKMIAVILMVVSSAALAAEDSGYPGQSSEWDSRYTVGCSMTDNTSGAVNYQFWSGNLDYAQASSMMVRFQEAARKWYGDAIARRSK